MHNRLPSPFRILSLAAIPGVLAVAATTADADLVFAVKTDNSLISFDSSTPAVPLSGTFIQNLQPGEQIVGIDFRPADNQLYGLGSSSRLYTINTTTGFATAVSAAPFSTPLNGTRFGTDFNPTVDLFRVISEVGQNLRVNPNTGALVSVDTPMNYAAGDIFAGRAPSIVGTAYTNSFPGATSTMQFAIDSRQNSLARVTMPNAGTLSTIGTLGIDVSNLLGFDIAASDNTAFAAFQMTGSGISQFYTVDLTTGTASLVGDIGGGSDLIRDIAVVIPEPAAASLLAAGGLLVLRRRR